MPSLTRVRRRWWLLLLVVVVGLAAGGWTWLGRDGDPTTTRITATATRGTQRETVSATGTITPRRQADLSFAASGTVTEVAVEPGSRVQKGDVLARIDTTALRAERDAAAAQVDAAESQVSEAADGTDAEQASAAAALASARSALAQAQEALDGATLTAPFAGTVTAVGVDVGDTVGGSGGNGGNGNVNASASDQGSSAAVTLISPRAMLVDATVAASDVSRIRAGMQAEITPAGSADKVYGTVEKVGAIATTSDTGAAEFPVTIAVTGRPTGLYAGASADVSIVVKQANDVLTVPTQAIRSSGSQTWVYVIEGGKRRKQAVTLGTTYGAQTEITKGLAEGDTVELVSLGRRPGGNRNGRAPGGGPIEFPAPAGAGGKGGPGGPVIQR